MIPDRDVVLFATADWDNPYWTNKQHTATHLARRGYRVLYVESVGLRAPSLNRIDLTRIVRRLGRGLQAPRQVFDHIWVMSPLTIPYAHHTSTVRAWNQRWLGSRIKAFLIAHGMSYPMIWTYHPFMIEACEGLPHARLIYHCVDDLAAIPGIDAAAFNREEVRLLERADVVFTTSEALTKKCALRNSNVHLFPNVADLEHFAMAHRAGALPADLSVIPEPRLAYVGVLSDFKVNFQLLLDAAKLRPDWSWVFIGEEREGQHSALLSELRALPNVHFLGFREYARLPEYLRGVAVGLIPSLINDYTRSMFPMKYFEYLAAGVPVLATPLDFTRTAAHCTTAATPEALVSAAQELIVRGRLSESAARRAVAGNTWEARLDVMLDLAQPAR